MSFDPVERRKMIWATDARRIGSGRSLEVYLEKTGAQDPPDLSQIEAVQMGHVMQPVIGKLAEERLGIRLRDMSDTAIVYGKEPYMASHFDFLSDDNSFLVEAKNYHSAARNKFGESGSDYVPPADYYQCLHEATVLGVDKVVLAVLFGGQEFCMFPLEFTQEQKDELVQIEANLWGRIQTGNPPEPQTAEEARKVFPNSRESQALATADVEVLAAKLYQIKSSRKALEEQEDALQAQICSFLGEKDTLVSADGSVLATWKTAKPSKRFSADAFKSAMPDIYQSFVIEQPGSRRFLVKGA